MRNPDSSTDEGNSPVRSNMSTSSPEPSSPGKLKQFKFKDS